MSDPRSGTGTEDIEMQIRSNPQPLEPGATEPPGPTSTSAVGDVAQQARRREARKLALAGCGGLLVAGIVVGVAAGTSLHDLDSSGVNASADPAVTSRNTGLTSTASNTGASAPSPESAAESSATPTLTYVESTPESTDGTEASKHGSDS